MAVFNFDKYYGTFNMLNIDPGFNNLGVSIFEVDTRSGRINKIIIESIVTDKAPSFSGYSEEYVPERLYKLRKIYDNVRELCSYYRPAILAHETPFYNPRMPAAFGSLVEVLTAVKNAVLDDNSNIYIEGISPQSVKKGVGAAGKKGKDIMFEHVLAIPELRDVLDSPIESLTEHCIDSMAVGWTVLNSILVPQEGWPKRAK